MQREQLTIEEVWSWLNERVARLPDSKGTRFSTTPYHLSHPTQLGRNWGIIANLMLGKGDSPDSKQVMSIVEEAYQAFNLTPEGSLQSN